MKKTIIIVICVVLLVSLNGCLKTRDKALKQIQEDETQPVSSIVLSEEDAKRMNEKLQVHLYFSDQDGTRLVREIRYISMEDGKQGAEQLASILVKELAKGPANTSLKATVPQGASLRSPVKLDGRMAIVDMTKDFIDNHPGGKEAEEMTIFSIVNTLTELKDIDTVKFQVNGKVQKEYKGSFRLDNEFPRNEALIDRKQSQTALPEGVPTDESTAQEKTIGQDDAVAEEDAIIQDGDAEDVSTEEDYEEEILE